jgi:hypothetical protein
MKFLFSLQALSIIFIGMFFLGCEKEFMYAEPDDSAVETLQVEQVTHSTAILSANIKKDRGSTITDRGICWSSINQTPSIGDSRKNEGGGTGYFTSAITGLAPNTTYYARAYATNSFGTAYGNTLTFKTLNVTVGQSYQGGIVAYILVPGDPGYMSGQTRGLVVTSANQSTGSQWGCSGVFISGTSTNFGSGKSNTTAITLNCTSTTNAARICDNLVTGGYSDWYLPSRDELTKIFLNRSLIGGLNNVSYWTSSQSSSTTSWSINFSTGTSTSATAKTTSLYVRAIRSF